MEFVDEYLLVLLLGLQCLLVYLFIDIITDFVLYYYSYLAFRRAIVGTDGDRSCTFKVFSAMVISYKYKIPVFTSINTGSKKTQ